MKKWLVSGLGGLSDQVIYADSFDEAIAKARLIDSRYCGAYIID